MESASRPRHLLRRLHTVMAGDGSGQEKLDTVVEEIARNMVAEVCSIYLVRSGELELFATEGLKKEAVHKARLQIGQGLVGLIAKRGLPLNLPEASDHPDFVYLKETGEELYHSLLGVPIIHRGQVAGVLVVQNAAQRHYTTEETEVLQTIAMVLAELVGSEDLLRNGNSDEKARRSTTLEGRKLSDGLARGRIVFHIPKIEITNWVSDDTDHEQKRLDTGFERMRQELERLTRAADLDAGGEHREIFETYKMFAYDRGWQDRIREAIDSGLTAEAAVERVQQDMRTRMRKTKDRYLRERLSDLEDLSNRLVRTILGFSGPDAHHALNEPSIVFARNMGPAELLDYDRTYLTALLLVEGSPTAHVTIIARALGIPILGRLKGDVEGIEPGDMAIVDAEAGRAIIRPSEEAEATYGESQRLRTELKKQYIAQKKLPPISQDGQKVDLLMNAGLLVDLPNHDEAGAEGIGLFRTEFQFMVASTLPRVEAQTNLYKKVLKAAGKKPVVFRTLDIGGDKRVPFLPNMQEENPALGWRALRLALDRPGLLRYQIRALLRATKGETLNLMFPMVTDVSEFRKARDFVNQEVERQKRFREKGPREIRLGCMLEVPSLAWQLDALLPELSFLCIGTNDLMQFFFASDRGNLRLTDRYDILSPAALGFLKYISDKAEAANVPLTVCGEVGSRPLEALALLGIGIRRLSVAAPAIPPLRMMIRQTDIGKVNRALVPKLSSGDHSLREWLLSYAGQQGIPV